jgi:hypothetical protein
MKKIGFIVWFLVLILLISGCASTVTLFGNAYPQKTEEATIDVYITKKPDHDYVEFAKIVCKLSDDKMCINQILKKAREIGADGVIIIGKAGTSSELVTLGKYSTYINNEEYGMTAIAIKYKE